MGIYYYTCPTCSAEFKITNILDGHCVAIICPHCKLECMLNVRRNPSMCTICNHRLKCVAYPIVTIKR